MQIEDLLFVTCPCGAAEEEEPDREVFWGDAAGAAAADAPPRLKQFDVVWAATGSRGAGWTLESLEAVARDLTSALRHEERRCGYVTRESARMLAAGADVPEGPARVSAQLAAAAGAEVEASGWSPRDASRRRSRDARRGGSLGPTLGRLDRDAYFGAPDSGEACPHRPRRSRASSWPASTARRGARCACA